MASLKKNSLYIYISRRKIAKFGHECLTKILNLNDSDDS
jgi:hypothetical protein